MGRPPSDLDDYLQWQDLLDRFKSSGMPIEPFCLQEGISRSSFYRWKRRLNCGAGDLPPAENVDRDRSDATAEAAFVPITLKASPVEIELPNGGVVRLPLGVGQAVLADAIRAVGALRPWKADKS